MTVHIRVMEPTSGGWWTFDLEISVGGITHWYRDLEWDPHWIARFWHRVARRWRRRR